LIDCVVGHITFAKRGTGCDGRDVDSERGVAAVDHETIGGVIG